jgi:hypothetical protein
MADQSETHSDNGIVIEVVWVDDDLVELLVRASNRRFSGTAEVYVASDELAKLAEALRGFPTSPSDRREFELGTFDANYAGGGARLCFWCKDALGHALVAVSLRTDPRYHFRRSETAELVIPIEPSAIDSFVRHLAHLDLARLEAARGPVARLEGSIDCRGE